MKPLEDNKNDLIENTNSKLNAERIETNEKDRECLDDKEDEKDIDNDDVDVYIYTLVDVVDRFPVP